VKRRIGISVKTENHRSLAPGAMHMDVKKQLFVVAK
jgi:hypothetical protein